MKEGRHDGLKIGAEFDFVTDGLPKRASRMKFLNIVIGRKLVRVPEQKFCFAYWAPPKSQVLGLLPLNATFGY